MSDLTIKGLLLAILAVAFAGIPMGMFVIHQQDQRIIDALHDEVRVQREPFEHRRFALRRGEGWYWGEVIWRHKPSSDGKEIWWAEELHP